MGAYFDFDIDSTIRPEVSTRASAPSAIYAIKRSEGFFWTEKPVLSAEISDVTYDFNNMEKKINPIEMNSAVLENYSHIPQTVIRTLSYTEESSSSFDFGSSVSVGLTVEVGIGIPIPLPLPTRIEIDVAVEVIKTEAFEVGGCLNQTIWFHSLVVF